MLYPCLGAPALQMQRGFSSFRPIDIDQWPAYLGSWWRSEPPPPMATLILMIISFFAGAGVTAALLGFNVRRSTEAAAELERAVIRAAMLRGGRITALDVRPPAQFALTDVEAQLRRMHTEGYCENDLTSDGRPIYVFSEYDEAPQRALRLESLILQMARTHQGFVDVSKIAAETELSYLEARRLLDEMTGKGICEPTERADTYRFFARRETGG